MIAFLMCFAQAYLAGLLGAVAGEQFAEGEKARGWMAILGCIFAIMCAVLIIVKKGILV